MANFGPSLNPQFMKQALILLSASSIILLSAGCKKDETPLLTPARKLEGTWKTPYPFKIYYETTFCDFSTYQLMATEYWSVTWEITEDASDANGNTVNIAMTYLDTGITYIQLCMGSTGITPMVRPSFFTGKISGAYLDVFAGTRQVGHFSFTTDNMEGNWDNQFCVLSCERDYSVNNEFKLQLQH